MPTSDQEKIELLDRLLARFGGKIEERGGKLHTVGGRFSDMGYWLGLERPYNYLYIRRWFNWRLGRKGLEGRGPSEALVLLLREKLKNYHKAVKAK